MDGEGVANRGKGFSPVQSGLVKSHDGCPAGTDLCTVTACNHALVRAAVEEGRKQKTHCYKWIGKSW